MALIIRLLSLNLAEICEMITLSESLLSLLIQESQNWFSPISSENRI